MDYRDRIVIDPQIRFGKPCVHGTRITVGDMLSYLASGMSEQDIEADFPQLTRYPRLPGVCRGARAPCHEYSDQLSGVLLFDENLAVRLVSALSDLYPNCAHVADRGVAGAPDLVIWRHAGEQRLAIVSKDGDFQQLSVLYGAPPKVIWIRSGNCSTNRESTCYATIERILIASLPTKRPLFLPSFKAAA